MPEINEKIDDALKVIFKEINTMETDSLAATLAAHLQSEHRTLQQNFFRGFVEAMKIYQNSGTDLRNEASVKFAKNVVQEGHYFPYV